MRRISLWLLAALAIAGCGRGGADLDVPMPALEGAPALVAERVRSAAEAIVREPDSAAAWGRLGAVYDLNGFPDQAVACYARAGELAPDDWSWPYFAGLTLRDRDPRAARARFERAAELKPDYLPLQFQLGYVALGTRDLDTARARFESVLEADPRFIDAILGLAHVEVYASQPAAALETIRRAVVLAPDEAAVHLHLAEAHRMLGDEEQALREERLARSSRVPPRKDGFATLPDPVRDEVTLKEGVTVDLLLANARRYAAAQRGAEASEALRLAVEADPDSVDVRLESSRILARFGAFKPAAAEAQHALALDGSRADVQAQLGEVLAWSGQRERAVEILRHALEMDPGLDLARGTLGMLLVDTDRADEGFALLRAACEALPGNADLQYNLAAALVRSGKLDDAREAAEHLVEARPGFAPAHALLGTIHAMAGRPGPSVAALERAVALAPNDVEARMDLGGSLAALGRHAESIAAFGKAHDLRPNDPEIARQLAWALATSPEEGARDGGRALELARGLCESSRNENPMHLETLAAAQAATGSFAAAGETAGKALALVETALAGLDPKDAARRDVLREFATQLRARRERYQKGTL